MQASAKHSRRPRHGRELSLTFPTSFTFHGPAGSGGRYQPCLTEEHNWFADGTPVTQASFDGIGSGGAERVSHDSWSSSSCEGGFNPATTREFTVGEILRARVILEVLVDATRQDWGSRHSELHWISALRRQWRSAFQCHLDTGSGCAAGTGTADLSAARDSRVAGILPPSAASPYRRVTFTKA